MLRTPTAQLAEGVVYEFVFYSDVLNRSFIEQMAVCFFRHGLLFTALPVFHSSGLFFIVLIAEDYGT
jgi:hypothetical protein